MRAGLEIESGTTPVTSDFLQIRNEGPPGAGGTFSLVSYQIIYVEAVADVSIFELAEDRDADDAIGTYCHAHFAAIVKYLPHLFRIVGRQLRT